MVRITKQQAKDLGEHFKINFNIVPFEEWHHGLKVELEHGSKFGQLTNVTKNALDKTAKIAIAHLIEDPRYYHYLKKMEEKREEYWKNRNKPDIFEAEN
jgi:hypothetical protein